MFPIGLKKGRAGGIQLLKKLQLKMAKEEKQLGDAWEFRSWSHNASPVAFFMVIEDCVALCRALCVASSISMMFFRCALCVCVSLCSAREATHQSISVLTTHAYSLFRGENESRGAVLTKEIIS